MRNIFKTGFGFHVDLSAIVAISELSEFGNEIVKFEIDIQLCDKPKEVTCWERWEEGESAHGVKERHWYPADIPEETLERYRVGHEKYKTRVRADWDALFNAWKNAR